MDRKYKIYHFENGFKLFTLPLKKGKDSLFYTCIDILCGSDLENSRNLEHCHFLEHLNGFFTSPKYPDGKKNENTINNLGITSNATVTSTFTSYYMTGLSKFKDIMIDMILNSFVNFKIDKKIVKQERNATKKELQSKLNQTWNKLYDKENKIKYPGHFRRENLVNYKKRIKSVENAKIEDLLEFRDKYYKYDRCMFTVAGDYGSDNDIIKIVEKFLKTKLLKKKPKLPNHKDVFPIINPPTSKKITHFVKNKNAKTSKIIISFKLPFDAFSLDKLKLNLVSNLLTRGLSSILIKKLRSDSGLVYYVRSNDDVEYNKAYSYFDIYTEVDHDKIPICVDLILKEIIKLKKNKITKKQFIKLKNTVNYDFSKRKYSDKLSYWVNTYFFKSIWNRKVVKIKKLKYYYSKITKKQIKNIVNKCFNKKTIKIIYSGKGKNMNKNIMKLNSLKNLDK